MIRTLKILLAIFFVIGIQSCKTQSGKKQGEVLKSKVDAVMDTYNHPTSKDGLYTEAKVDGKEWKADWMFVDPDPDNSINVNAHKEDGAVISFYIGKSVIKEKKNKNFSEVNPVQMVDGKGNILTGNEGEYQITNVTDKWIEGNFHFTAKDVSSGKTIQVSDGFFRVGMTDKFKEKLNM